MALYAVRELIAILGDAYRDGYDVVDITNFENGLDFEVADSFGSIDYGTVDTIGAHSELKTCIPVDSVCCDFLVSYSELPIIANAFNNALKVYKETSDDKSLPRAIRDETKSMGNELRNLKARLDKAMSAAGFKRIRT